MMDRPRIEQRADRNSPELADSLDLRSAIAVALLVQPIDQTSLHYGVWTYVGAERHSGTSPGRVIMTLTELVEAARIAPTSARQTVMRQVILWCVEAYFGHLGGDVVGRDGTALSDLTALGSSQ